MCKDCLNEVRPDVQQHATDSGANMLNYKGCCNCKQVTLLKSSILEQNKDDDEDNDEYFEEIRFEHKCSICDHVVAQHFYTYHQDDDEQTYNMDCFLCGRGGKTVSFETVFDDLKKKDDHSESQPIEKPPCDLVGALIGARKIPLPQEDDNKQDDDAEWE